MPPALVAAVLVDLHVTDSHTQSRKPYGRETSLLLLSKLFKGELLTALHLLASPLGLGPPVVDQSVIHHLSRRD